MKERVLKFFVPLKVIWNSNSKDAGTSNKWNFMLINYYAIKNMFFFKSVTISLHLSAFRCMLLARGWHVDVARALRSTIWATVVLSTNFRVYALVTLKSLFINRNSKGHNLAPWVTPAGTGPHSEKQSEDSLMRCCLLVRKSATQYATFWGIGRLRTLCTSILCYGLPYL